MSTCVDRLGVRLSGRQRGKSRMNGANHEAHQSMPIAGNGVHRTNGFNDVVSEGDIIVSNGKTKVGRHDSTLSEMDIQNSSPVSTSMPDLDREEVVRLLIQSLDDMGYSKASSQLASESGYATETFDVSNFRSAVLNGEWDGAEALIKRLQLRDHVNMSSVLFLLRKQKFLELLEARDLSRALMVLRSELSPLDIYVDQLHNLSTLLMCATPAEIFERSGWDGSRGISRQSLLNELQSHISPTAMLPRQRLNTLLTQAKLYQIGKCLYHSSDEPFSLLSNHSCDRGQFPSQQIEILTMHSDEVWFVQFSHDGTRLASSSKDMTAIIWSMDTFSPVHMLKEHEGAITCLDWSPDDRQILTSSQDCKVKLWDTESGAGIRTFDGHQNPVSVCAWLSRGDAFVTAGMDKEIIIWSPTGVILHQFNENRIYDLAITPDGKKLIAICTAKMLHIYDLEEKVELTHICLQTDLTSVHISSDSRYALINTAAQEVELWDLIECGIVRKFVGHQQKNYVIRSCFGGASENFVLSGSEGLGVVYLYMSRLTLQMDVFMCGIEIMGHCWKDCLATWELLIALHGIMHIPICLHLLATIGLCACTCR